MTENTMKIQQLYTNCLAEAAYFLENDGKAIIIDPIRDIDPYLQMLEEKGLELTHILETHFHADFVSGHIDLAQKTNAKIVFGPNAETEYDIHVAKDGEVIPFGDHQIKVIHTPGHTMESTCYLLMDNEGHQKALFSGDTLFIGDVGRPDLAVKSELSMNDLAGMLYDSLRNKIMTLSNDILVYPAHGAGSSCGKNLSKETYDTLGNQKKNNYALQEMTKEEFIKEVTDGIQPAPEYFPKAANLNKSGYKSFETIVNNARALALDEFKSEMNQAIYIDTRHQKDFCEAHIPGSIFIGIDGGFAIWAASVVGDIHQPIIFVADEGREEEVITRLSRVGFDNIVGYLEGGFETWKKAEESLEQLPSFNVDELLTRIEKEGAELVDVRKPGEYESLHVKGVRNLPLDFIKDNHLNYQEEKDYYLHCRSGYRSVVAGSVLKKKGVKNVYDVAGGFVALEKSNLYHFASLSSCSS